MTHAEITYPISLKGIPKTKHVPFDITFTEEDMSKVRTILSAVSVKKMRISGKISPLDAKDWLLSATVGVTVTQSCVITLKPVQTRLDLPVKLKYVAEYEKDNDESVTEMTIDETIEPLTEEIDLATVAIEAIALALPDYPRSENATLENAVFAEPGVKPMTDEDTKPFASLASLKDKLSQEDK
ncbi:DUF177 domain-containing protein [Amylibacter sp. SFDW26]|uniref:YceD family protein n=1 Tax=Amylibacter sp. SFDW26 TaxID=2652722 RepID=UPI00126292C4|nr:DUF177 domain-containing protein [Amylibacter sp. SFDW26]KAB7616308.1 DUF177 domain-containing protein [Amylibacter sp. SFDW26]